MIIKRWSLKKLLYLLKVMGIKLYYFRTKFAMSIEPNELYSLSRWKAIKYKIHYKIFNLIMG